MSSFNYQRGEYMKPGGFKLPSGFYEIVCTVSDYDFNNAGTGKVLKLTFDVVSGKYADKKHFNNLNLEFPESWLVERDTNSLNGILEAIDAPKDGNTDVLLGKKLCVEVQNWVNKKGEPKQTFIYHPAGYSNALSQNARASTAQSATPPPPQTDEDIPF